VLIFIALIASVINVIIVTSISQAMSLGINNAKKKDIFDSFKTFIKIEVYNGTFKTKRRGMKSLQVHVILWVFRNLQLFS
jgi:hypothetical protein